MDLATILDFKRAAENVKTDLVGDWYRDPWGWPELAWALTDPARPLLSKKLASAKVSRIELVDVAKSNFGVRPAIIMDPIDRLLYQSLVDQLSKTLIGSLDPSIFGWRLPPTDPENGKYSHQNVQWDSFRSRLRDSEKNTRAYW